VPPFFTVPVVGADVVVLVVVAGVEAVLQPIKTSEIARKTIINPNHIFFNYLPPSVRVDLLRIQPLYIYDISRFPITSLSSIFCLSLKYSPKHRIKGIP
jgi:hypothetical protein